MIVRGGVIAPVCCCCYCGGLNWWAWSASQSPHGGGLQLKPSCPHVRPSEREEGNPSSDFYHAQSNASRVDIPASEPPLGKKSCAIIYIHTHPAKKRSQRTSDLASPAKNPSVAVADHNFLVFMPRSKLFTFLRLLLFSSSCLILLMGARL